MMKTCSFENKIVVITGAASGMGQAIALAAGRDQAVVVAKDVKLSTSLPVTLSDNFVDIIPKNETEITIVANHAIEIVNRISLCFL